MTLQDCIRPSSEDEALALIEAGFDWLRQQQADPNWFYGPAFSYYGGMSECWYAGLGQAHDRNNKPGRTIGEAVANFRASLEESGVRQQLKEDIAAYTIAREIELGLREPPPAASDPQASDLLPGDTIPF